MTTLEINIPYQNNIYLQDNYVIYLNYLDMEINNYFIKKLNKLFKIIKIQIFKANFNRFQKNNNSN